jgi:sugar phosphate isomerase/epimerase
MKINKTIVILGLAFFAMSGCQNKPKGDETLETGKGKKPKYSLAQWSFNRELFAKQMSTIDYIEAAGEMGFDGVEYVSQFFQNKVEDVAFLDSLNEATKKAGVKSLIIMVDNIGNLGASNKIERDSAIENCKKWVKAAKYLGCTGIRVNAHGDGTPEEIKAHCLDGIGRLAAWSKNKGIEIIIENHGGISNNGAWLADLVKALQPHNVGTLPDFDNWCTQRENGQLWGGSCTEQYDRYKGMTELMPFAKGLSVKSFEFDAAGNETTMDYARIFEIVQAAGYEGYLGIEFEGHNLPSREGIAKTRALVEKVWK